MAGIRPPDNAAPAAQPESTEGKHCTLFVLCSQYVLFAAACKGIFIWIQSQVSFGGECSPVPNLKIPILRSLLWRFRLDSNQCTVLMLRPRRPHACGFIPWSENAYSFTTKPGRSFGCSQPRAWSHSKSLPMRPSTTCWRSTAAPPPWSRRSAKAPGGLRRSFHSKEDARPKDGRKTQPPIPICNFALQ